MTNPSEEARRALREARERVHGRRLMRGQADEGAEVETTPGPTSSQADVTAEAAADDGAEEELKASAGVEGEAVDTAARPSDAARAALRRAVSSAHGPRTTGDSEATPSTAAPEAAGGDAGQRTARPADVAREALRAARRDRSRLTPAPATETTRAPRNPARDDESAVRARAMRELLANAFKMPPEPADTTEPESPDEPSRRPARPSARRSVPDPGARAAAAEPESREELLRRPAPPSARRRTAPDAVARAESTEPASPDEPSGRLPRPSPRRRTAPDPAARADTAEPESPDEPSPRPARPATPRRTPADSATRGDATPPPHVPRSMAAPSRDGELRRTFPAFPPRGSGEGGFARTWWGNAWVAALEEGALDGKRLARGRGYAEQGHVDAITVTPGLVLAYVKGSRPRPYRVQVRMRTLDDADWERFLDAAAERPGHIAALLDKEMPHSLAECGVPLLPGPWELDPQCSCPDSGHPCKHAAALCYQTARLLDADPFVLLLLRGRGERELLDALSRLSAARAARAAQDQGPAPLPGVRASEALAPRRLPPLPPPLPVPPHPEQPPVYPAAPGGPDPFALDQLATDAAARAHALLGTGRDPLAELTLWQDAVRLAAARPGSGLTAGSRALYAELAAACDRTPAELARAVAAWRQGGPEGLAVLEEPWDPPAGRFDRARPLLLAADLPAFRPWRNHLTHPRGHVQLRLGRDGLWYTYESEPGQEDWWPRGTPDLDPVGALTGLGGPVEG